MLKQVLLLLLLSLTLRPAAAQTIIGESLASRQFKQQLREQYAHNDTAQAIINLYSRRQSHAGIWIQGSVIGALTSVFFNGAQYDTDYKPLGIGARLGIGALVAMPVVGYSVAKLKRYSNAHLDQLLTAYAAGQPLPRSLRRKLKQRFFRASIGQ
ncbi:MAG: hypothetical protein ACRYFX_26600 [Janthinobacterium lividum]